LSSSSRNISKNKKFRTALLSISVSIALIIIKVVFGILTNSISVLASAVDSFLDVTASSVNLYSIRKSEKPADHDHKFGHGKAEGLAGLFQTFIIGSSAVYLIYLSVLRLMGGGALVSVGWGIAVIALSMVVSFFLARNIKRVAEETGSLALSADSLHYKFDLYTNGGILAGLLVIKLTGLNLIDPIISMLAAAFIIWSTKDILIESIDILMDKELPPDTVSDIEDVIMRFNPSVKSFHKLKTRNAGSVKFVEFHVVMDHTLTFVKSHEIAEQIVREIKEKIGNSEVTVHVDPDKR
jgi:cation diffusion facilitator family transporter